MSQIHTGKLNKNKRGSVPYKPFLSKHCSFHPKSLLSLHSIISPITSLNLSSILSISNNKLHILGSNHGGSQSGNCFIDQSAANNAQISSDLLISGWSISMPRALSSCRKIANFSVLPISNVIDAAINSTGKFAFRKAV